MNNEEKLSIDGFSLLVAIMYDDGVSVQEIAKRTLKPLETIEKTLINIWEIRHDKKG